MSRTSLACRSWSEMCLNVLQIHCGRGMDLLKFRNPLKNRPKISLGLPNLRCLSQAVGDVEELMHKRNTSFLRSTRTQDENGLSHRFSLGAFSLAPPSN